MIIIFLNCSWDISYQTTKMEETSIDDVVEEPLIKGSEAILLSLGLGIEYLTMCEIINNNALFIYDPIIPTLALGLGFGVIYMAAMLVSDRHKRKDRHKQEY